MRMKNAGRRLWLLAILAGVPLILAACQQGTENSSPMEDDLVAGASATLSCGSGVAVDLDCPALPNTAALGKMVDETGAVNASTAKNIYLDYDLWAWNSFVAMNWPASDPTVAGNQRGIPDTSSGASFATAANDATAVWETYKEKREVFLYDYVDNEPAPVTDVPAPWNTLQYGPADLPVPCCTTGGCDSGGNVFQRELGSASKLFFDTLDETAEVKSPPIESREALCKGWIDPATCTSTVPPAPNTCCGFVEASQVIDGQARFIAPPVGPRVWRGDPFTDDNATPILYEVKVNKDFFDYVTADKHKYYYFENVRDAASQGKVKLPARTSKETMPPVPGSKAAPSGPSGPPLPGPNPGGGSTYTATNYKASTCLGNYQKNEQCRTGSVHLKAGWIDLTDASDSEKKKYHIADVFHYKSVDESTTFPGGICKEPATYGLSGLHIIQRIHQNDKANGGDGSGRPRGGTFIFATWEHSDNDSLGFTYANYSDVGPTGKSEEPAPFPNIEKASALPLNRLYDPLSSTVSANTLVHNMLGCDSNPGASVWCNYRLIGTQFAAATAPAGDFPRALPATPNPGIEVPADSGQPFYLANLVIESNVGLQHFQGLPPSPNTDVIQVIPHYKGGNPGNVTSSFSTNEFQFGASNLAYRTQSGNKNTPHEFVMGGCMGCHGVAQLSGYSFSFVLLDNQFGAAPDTVTEFTLPPVGPTGPTGK